MSNLNSFISKIKKYGVPLSSKFEIELPSIDGFADPSEVNLLCNSASMPDLKISVAPLKIFGENNYLAGGTEYGQLQLTFLITSDFLATKYFEAWQDSVFSKPKRTVGFYKNYAKSVTVHNLDRGGDRIYSVEYYECFPISVQTTGVSYDNNHPLTLNVTLAYRVWYSNTAPDEDLFDPEMNPLKLNSPSALRAFDNSTLVSPLAQYNGNGIAAATALGPIMGSSALAAANQAAQGVTSLSNLSDGTQVGSLMSKYMNQIGTSSSIIGAGIGDIGGNLNTILAPAQAIAGGVTSLSSVLSSTNNLLSRMGIHTNIGNVVSDLNGVAGIVSVVGQLNGIPGALSSLGSVMGSVGGEITNIQRSLVNVPGATSSMVNSIGNLGQVTNNNANTISSMSGMNFSNSTPSFNGITPMNIQASYFR